LAFIAIKKRILEAVQKDRAERAAAKSNGTSNGKGRYDSKNGKVHLTSEEKDEAEDFEDEKEEEEEEDYSTENLNIIADQ